MIIYCTVNIFIRPFRGYDIMYYLCDKTQGLPELDVRIKWPNDLYLKGLKVGGILCTSSYEPKVYNICTGKHVSTAVDSTHCGSPSCMERILDQRSSMTSAVSFQYAVFF
jgi:biotin-(acetyl-CoA carboxylase) ligase